MTAAGNVEDASVAMIVALDPFRGDIHWLSGAKTGPVLYQEENCCGTVHVGIKWCSPLSSEPTLVHAVAGLLHTSFFAARLLLLSQSLHGGLGVQPHRSARLQKVDSYRLFGR
jgi:hypothetical protein